MTSGTAQTKDEITLDPKSFSDAVKMVLKNFLSMTSTRKSSERNGSIVIDVKLREKRNFYKIQMTHCGRWTNKRIENIFNELRFLIENGMLPNNAIIARIFTRTSSEQNENGYEIQGGPDFIRKKIEITDYSIHYPSFKNYAMVNLQYKLLSQNLLEFKKIMTTEFNELKKSHPHVKITFYLDDDIFYNNHVISDDDFRNCQLLSSSLIDIVKQSTDTQFKKRCLQTLEVDNIYDGQKIVQRTLFAMIHKNYMYL